MRQTDRIAKDNKAYIEELERQLALKKAENEYYNRKLLWTTIFLVLFVICLWVA